MNPIRKVAKVVIVALGLFAWSHTLSSAQGTTPLVCGDRSKIVNILADRYKEKLYAQGIVSRVDLLEIHVSEKGTWTLLMTAATGRSCVIAAGEDWEVVKTIYLDPKT